eukprot:CAMPEP_0170631604 /NCGR_PEP_ID=MMETSP0224-20130122/34748_1 /TAXON_ID=285029 /ORGANISM="Togula jolla, Strain CCCM 725" /LENGTH=52 /DNA_ID=CAMNT_0010959991 /DNA_START=351 /DNA_END=509 /DNA_ORIENTATION=-
MAVAYLASVFAIDTQCREVLSNPQCRLSTTDRPVENANKLGIGHVILAPDVF